MQCQRKECEAEATHAPVLVIPAKGGSPTQLGRLRAIISLQLCKPCCEAVKPDDMLSEQGKSRLAMQCLTARARQPDFARTTIEAIPVASGEFQAFLRRNGPA